MLTPITIRALLLLTAIACSVPAAVPPATHLIGRWLMTGTREKPLDANKFGVEWEFTPDEIVVRDRKTGEEVSRNRYTVDITKSPAWIIVAVAGPAPETRVGIFRVRGDELHLKQQIGTGERPLDFGRSYSILRRIE
jgi:uncharacterized protein (TIGR03067 family)